MGTNYYLIKKEDLEDIKLEYKHSNILKKLYPKIDNLIDVFKIHIGKSSMGSRFRFQSQPQFKTFKELKKILCDYSIYDEYDELVDVNTFLELIEDKQNLDYNFVREDDYLDEKGYLFTNGDFS